VCEPSLCYVSRSAALAAGRVVCVPGPDMFLGGKLIEREWAGGYVSGAQ
jgi:hypothetical protein